MKRLHLQAPPSQKQPSRLRKVARQAAGSVLAPGYWLLAHRHNTPGLHFHWLCARLGLQLALKRSAPLSLGWSYQLVFSPMDSTRYFEFDFFWRALADPGIGRYLDVSSPRLFPLVLMNRKRVASADLLNPDANDLATTAAIVRAGGFQCRLHRCRIEDALFPSASFDLVTSISVVEHIIDDTEAVMTLWKLLAPGGRLLLSVPCSAEAAELYINRNEYGMMEPDETGFAFFERIYDGALLDERILCVTGKPLRQAVYGEKVAGSFMKNAQRKRSEYFTAYPFWREPYMMAREYGYFSSIADLPGEGVIALEFLKP